MKNYLYELHHSLEPVNIEITTKILKMNCFENSKKHFELDYLHDIGIINLLRKKYFLKGDFKSIFNFYQANRLDPSCHRYESLFALLIISIVGTVALAIAFWSGGKTEQGGVQSPMIAIGTDIDAKGSLNMEKVNVNAEPSGDIEIGTHIKAEKDVKIKGVQVNQGKSDD